jgi:hypothetical protein
MLFQYCLRPDIFKDMFTTVGYSKKGGGSGLQYTCHRRRTNLGQKAAVCKNRLTPGKDQSVKQVWTSSSWGSFIKVTGVILKQLASMATVLVLINK